MTNDSYCGPWWGVLLSFNFAAVLYKIYFLFRLLQPNRLGGLTNIMVLLTILYQWNWWCCHKKIHEIFKIWRLFVNLRLMAELAFSPQYISATDTVPPIHWWNWPIRPWCLVLLTGNNKKIEIKGIFQPFELGGVTRCIRSAVKFWKAGN